MRTGVTNPITAGEVNCSVTTAWMRRANPSLRRASSISCNTASFSSGRLLRHNFSASATSKPARASMTAAPPSQTKASQGVHAKLGE